VTTGCAIESHGGSSVVSRSSCTTGHRARIVRHAARRRSPCRRRDDARRAVRSHGSQAREHRVEGPCGEDRLHHAVIRPIVCDRDREEADRPARRDTVGAEGSEPPSTSSAHAPPRSIPLPASDLAYRTRPRPPPPRSEPPRPRPPPVPNPLRARSPPFDTPSRLHSGPAPPFGTLPHLHPAPPPPSRTPSRFPARGRPVPRTTRRGHKNRSTLGSCSDVTTPVSRAAPCAWGCACRSRSGPREIPRARARRPARCRSSER
jgi:hypothetical protein